MSQQKIEEKIENPILQNTQHLLLLKIVKISLIQIISYFKFTQITPVVIMYGGMIGLFLALGQETFGPNFTKLPLVLISLVLNLDPAKPATLGVPELIKLFLFCSLVLFLLTSFLNLIFKIKFKIAFKNKIIAVTIIPVICYGLFFIYILLFPKVPVEGDLVKWIFICIFLSLITVVTGIYAVIISAASNSIVDVISQDGKIKFVPGLRLHQD